jgi:hypothetical protein
MDAIINKSYNNHYNIIYKNFLYEIRDNSKILCIGQKEYNLLNDFSHIIKKKNLEIHIKIDDVSILEKIKEEIKCEDCEKNIILIGNCDSNNNNNYFDYILIFGIKFLDIFSKQLSKLYGFLNNNGLIYLYSSLSNEKNINKKNYIRSTLKLNEIYSLSDFLEIIENNYQLKIESINILKKTSYILYGNHVVYKIILAGNLGSSSTHPMY